MFINDSVKMILNKVESAGFEIYLVGGCVRDSIMNKTPHDFDFTTSATPEKILKIFEGYNLGYTGIAYGTVIVELNGEFFEITTYRTDGEYSDGRHPDSVSFSKNLLDDLSRRDFTMNAIAYSPRHGYVDPFGGKDDIKNGIIRSVGEADKRFNEDALRIIRAIRFASQFNFEIEKDTEKAMFKNKSLIRFVSRERYTKEFKKIMSSKNTAKYLEKFWDILFVDYPEFLKFDGFDQENIHHLYDLKMHTIKAIELYEGDNPLVKIALLFHDIGKLYTKKMGDDGQCHYHEHNIVSVERTKAILYDMRFETNEIKYICSLVKYHDSRIPAEINALKKWVIRLGEEGLRNLLDLSMADCLAHKIELCEKRRNRILEVRYILPDTIAALNVPSKKDLKINGRDIIELGFKEGKIIGVILDDIFDAVLDEILENDHEVLIAYVKSKYLASTTHHLASKEA